MNQTLLTGEVTPTVRKWNRYPEYKDSEVIGIGEIPGHWTVQRLKFIAKRIVDCKNRTPPYYPDGEFLVVRTTNVKSGKLVLDDVHYTNFEGFQKWTSKETPEPGNVILTREAPAGEACIVPPNLPLCLGQRLTLIQLNNSTFNAHFLLYLIYGGIIQSFIQGISAGSTVTHIRLQEIFNIPCLIPSIDEQQAIASFLDRETAKIDALIAKKERLIELLQEKRTAIISHAVTKGLDPTVPMKDSGFEWLGDIPAHWQPKKIKYLTYVISKGTTPTTIGAEFVDDGIRFIKAENIADGVISDEPAKYIDAETHHLQLKRSILNEYDILMVIAGATTGKVAIVNPNKLPANINQAVAFVRLRDPNLARFLLHWLGSNKIQEQVWFQAVQSAQPNLSLEDIKNFSIPVPPLDEAIKIVKYLDRETAKIDALIAKIREGMEKLKEYRTALISAAVTGKIDVRNEVAS